MTEITFRFIVELSDETRDFLLELVDEIQGFNDDDEDEGGTGGDINNSV